MSGNGVVMMQKFIEANGLVNSESPAIFVEVHRALDIKLKRIEKIKAIYAEDNEDAPMTKCPHCGSPSLIVRNCEFCGYAMLEGEGSDEVSVQTNEPDIKETMIETKPETAKEAPARASRGRGTVAPVTDTKPEEKKEPLQASEEKPARTSRAKAPVVPTKEEINKARRPGLIKIVNAHSLTMTVDLDKAELKDIRIELLSVLLGESTPVVEKKTKVKTEAKKEVSVPTIDFSKAPNNEALEGMTEEQMLKVITDYGLPLTEEVKTLAGGKLEDNDFFDVVDAIVASLKSEEKKSKETKAEPVKTRTKRTASEPKKEAVKLVEIKVDDLPESEPAEGTAPVEGVNYLSEMTEVELAEVINKFGLDLKEELKTLSGGKLADDVYFGIVDAVDAKLEAIANDINDGKKPTYPATEVKAKTARTKKAPVSEAKLEAGNETDSNYEDVDLDNADINYDDINIEDIANEA